MLTLAEARGMISHPYLQFVAGHRGDIEARYSTEKGRLPPEMIEDMRHAYDRCAAYLSTTNPEMREEKFREEFKKTLLAVAGFSEDEVAKFDLRNMEDEELRNLVRQKLLGVMANNGSRQKVVPSGDVERYLSEGWEYVAALDNKAIIKVPF
jgi:hypothetical protein